VPSETAKPYAFCGGAVRGVKFAPAPMAFTVAFLDDTAPNGTVLTEVKVPEGGTVAEFAGDGSRVAAIHFKVVDPPSEASLCLAAVEVLVKAQ
jgi:hypothetical protein